jgi:hypothetical protein
VGGGGREGGREGGRGADIFVVNFSLSFCDQC